MSQISWGRWGVGREGDTISLAWTSACAACLPEPSPVWCPPPSGSAREGQEETRPHTDCPLLRANRSITVGAALAALLGGTSLCSAEAQDSSSGTFLLSLIYYCVLFKQVCTSVLGQGGPVASRTWSWGPNDLGVRSPWENKHCV